MTEEKPCKYKKLNSHSIFAEICAWSDSLHQNKLVSEFGVQSLSISRLAHSAYMTSMEYRNNMQHTMARAHCSPDGLCKDDTGTKLTAVQQALRLQCCAPEYAERHPTGLYLPNAELVNKRPRSSIMVRYT